MKIKILLLVTATVVAANVFAGDEVAAPNYKIELSSVAVLEMPAKAATLVSKAPVKDRAVITAAVIKNVADLKVTALPATVGAIAKATPEMAATAAAAATSAQPKLAVDVAKAAAAMA